MKDIKADDVKHDEIASTVATASKGVNPEIISIRKKGFRRALKSKKLWALHKQWFIDAVNKLENSIYSENYFGILDRTDEPKIKMRGLSEWLPGEK